MSPASTCNGFYHGCSSRSRELSGCFPSSAFDYPNCNKGDVSEKFFKGASFVDLKSMKDMNSNLITEISSNEAVPPKDLEVISEKGAEPKELDQLVPAQVQILEKAALQIHWPTRVTLLGFEVEAKLLLAH
ncbi:hypothetical protein LguiA_003367 [Lonicera macranthoides]